MAQFLRKVWGAKRIWLAPVIMVLCLIAGILIATDGEHFKAFRYLSF